jgi:hypothetical protein
MNDLPKLTPKENAFVFHLFTDCINSPTKAYKLSYDCENSSENTIYVEASRLMKNPKITLWIEYYESTLQEFQKEEIKYTRKDFFNDLDRIRAKTEDSQKTVSVALKAVELKGKSLGYLKENVELSGSTTVQMGEIKIDNKALDFNIGGKSGLKASSPSTPHVVKGVNEVSSLDGKARPPVVKGEKKETKADESNNTRDVKPSAQNVSDDNGVQ